MTDFLLLEKLQKLVVEKRRRRAVFEKGICAEGAFRPYFSFADYTSAGVFSDPDTETPVFVRFSSMLGDWGTADTARNIKGLAVKFMTPEGVYDMMCQSLPVFFTDDWKKLPQLADTLSGGPHFGRPDSRKLWDFVLANRESINCILHFYSRCGVSASFLSQSWYTADTFIWRSASGNRHLVRYRWVPVENMNNRSYRYACDKASRMDSMFAEFMAGFDPDTAIEDIRCTFDDGEEILFELQVQITGYSHITSPWYMKRTLCWNEELVPPVPVGVMRLERMADDVYGGEHIFAPGNMIPGIEMCDDGFAAVTDHLHRMAGSWRYI